MHVDVDQVRDKSGHVSRQLVYEPKALTSRVEARSGNSESSSSCSSSNGSLLSKRLGTESRQVSIEVSLPTRVLVGDSIMESQSRRMGTLG
jgi:hypothetical protein